MGVSMISPDGFAMRPRMPASWRICCFEPRAPESAMMYTGLKVLPSRSSASISLNIAFAICSVASDQMAMTLL